MRRFTLLSALTFGLAGVLSAQTGRIVGTVSDTSGRPIGNAQVFVVGTSLTALTDSLGRFVLEVVPVGRQDLRAAFVGFRPLLLRELPVGPTDSTSVEFRLLPAPVQISDETFWSCVFSPRNEPNVPRDLASTRWRIRVIEGALTRTCP